MFLLLACCLVIQQPQNPPKRPDSLAYLIKARIVRCLWCAPCAGPVTYGLLDLARRLFHASHATFFSR